MYFKKKTEQTLEMTNFVLLGFLVGFIYLFYKKMYKHSLFLFLLMFILLMMEKTITNLSFVKVFSPVQSLLFYLSLHVVTNIFQILYVIFVYRGAEYFYKTELDYVEISQEEFLKLRYKGANSFFGAIFKIMYYGFGFLIYLVTLYYLLVFLSNDMNSVREKLFFELCFYLSVLFFVVVIFAYLKLFVGEVLRFVKIIANLKKIKNSLH